MWTIFKHELAALFTSLIAYVVIAVFIVFLGLMLFVFPQSSILELGYANLDSFFDLIPSVLMFLIPAITMRSISEEKMLGTLDLLRTKPLKMPQIVLAKLLASFVLVLFSLALTLCYFYTVYKLGNPIGNIDEGATWASYFGVGFLSLCFVSIGIFASSLSQSQIVSFLIAVLLCFILYYGIDLISSLPVFYGKTDLLIQKFGAQYHYLSLSRGVIDTRDIIYFLSVSVFFFFMSVKMLEENE